MRISIRVSAIAANYEVEFLKRLKEIIKLHILQVMCSPKSHPLDKREERGTIAKEKKAKELRYSPITVLLIAPHDNSPPAQLAGARDNIKRTKDNRERRHTSDQFVNAIICVEHNSSNKPSILSILDLNIEVTAPTSYQSKGSRLCSLWLIGKRCTGIQRVSCKKYSLHTSSWYMWCCESKHNNRGSQVFF
jgi:hypothetical protein